jgi:hypothetical protein
MFLKVCIVPAALLALLCTACNARKQEKTASLDVVTSAAPATAGEASTADSTRVVTDFEDNKQPTPRKAGTGGQQGGAQQVQPAPNPDWDRKIIRTADLALKVKNFQQFTNRLRAAVSQAGGYIAQEQQTQDASEIENTVAIKVPVDRFQDLLVQLPGDSDRLETKKVSSEDVTMELVDTKSRLETKKEVRERYLDLLKEAHSMKDIITVQNEINDIQAEMDQAAGRIAWLGHSSAYSTINLRFFQVLDETGHEDAPPGFVQRLKESIGEGWKSLSSLLLDLISVWPLWIALGFAVVWFKKWHSRTKALQPAKETVPEANAGV